MDWFFLDSCSLLNLAASQQLVLIAKTLKLRFSVIQEVYPKESQFVYLREGRTRLEAVPLDLSAVIESGVLRIEADLSPVELETFLELATAGIDDGEAMTAAAAIHRKAGLVTDDRKARRIITDHYPDITMIGSLGLVRQWAEKQRLSKLEILEVLENIEICARYTIGKRDPEFVWSQSLLKS